VTALVFAFYGEGATDNAFIATITTRTLSRMLPTVDILEPTILKDIHAETQIEKLVSAAKQANGYNLLIVHLDADAPNTAKAHTERFMPGLTAIKALEKNRACEAVVPVIPVRNSESWMLVDFQAFQEVVGTHKSATELGFVAHPHQAESISDPKEVFNSALRDARPTRRRINISDVYLPLAQRIRLELLDKIPAYQRFLEELQQTLRAANYLHP
jgi:hypothetical protein